MPKVSELPVSSPATVRALRDVLIGAETITTGASPVAANPDVGITFIITGGTAGPAEVITLALPTDPETKLSTKKRFVVRTLTNENDDPVIDNTNLVNANGDQLDASIIRLGTVNNWVEFELIYTPANVYGWQITAALNHGERRLFSTGFNYGNGLDATLNVNPGAGGYASLTAADGPTAGAALITAGNSSAGAGGSVINNPGTGTTDGGDCITELPAAGSGRQGLYRIRNMPTVDPGIADPTLIGNAVWLNAGVLTISVGSP